MVVHEFDFKGGIVRDAGGGVCKFLLFLLNGNKEVSLAQATKFGFASHKVADSLTEWSDTTYTTSLPIAKLVMYEDGGFGKERFSQSFWLALGRKLKRQVVTIRPRMVFAQARAFKFSADASFLKPADVLNILDPDSLSAKVLRAQRTPPVNVLRSFIEIDRMEAPMSVRVAEHGGIRKLRIR